MATGAVLAMVLVVVTDLINGLNNRPVNGLINGLAVARRRPLREPVTDGCQCPPS